MPVTQLQPTATPGKIRVFVAKAESTVLVTERNYGVADPTPNYAEAYANTNYKENVLNINYGKVPVAR